MLRGFTSAALRCPLDVITLRAATVHLLEFLASPRGRTDANCKTVDYFLTDNDHLWDALDGLESIDANLHSVIADMAGALHDTISAPGIAENFDSTPEQLLARARGQK